MKSSLSAPIFVRRRQRWEPAPSRSALRARSRMKEEERTAERRQTHNQPLHLPVQRAPCKGALAYRRSTTVLTRGTARPQGSAPGQASWDVVLTGVTRCLLSQSSGSTPRTGHNASEHDARSRPRVAVTSRYARAPRPAPPASVTG
jgi:hypothetical protein